MYLTSLAISEMQIRTTARYQSSLIKINRLLNYDNTKCQWRCEKSLRYCWRKCQMVQPLWKSVWQFLIELNILLPYNVAFALLGIWLNRMKTCVHSKSCIQMFMASLIILGKKPEAMQTSFNGWMHQRTVAHPRYGILLSNEQELASDPWNQCV